MDETKEYKYECEACEEKGNVIYACNFTNQWLCFKCLQMTDRTQARAVQLSEQAYKRSKEK